MLGTHDSRKGAPEGGTLRSDNFGYVGGDGYALGYRMPSWVSPNQAARSFSFVFVSRLAIFTMADLRFLKVYVTAGALFDGHGNFLCSCLDASIFTVEWLCHRLAGDLCNDSDLHQRV